MSTYPCPNGHASDDPEYCSECGKKIQGGTAPATTSPTTSNENCPDCGTPRASGGVFCEVCRYNFATMQPWTPGVVAATAVASEPVVAPVVSTVVATTEPVLPIRWEAVVSVDASLYVDPDPAAPCPVNTPERTFPLDFAENLIGRRSERRAIFPELDLTGDPGVSSRHAILYRESDGVLSIIDVGSTNGTQKDGIELQPGVRTPLEEGSQVMLGCWTRISIRQVKP